MLESVIYYDTEGVGGVGNGLRARKKWQLGEALWGGTLLEADGKHWKGHDWTYGLEDRKFLLTAMESQMVPAAVHQENDRRVGANRRGSGSLRVA